VFHPAQADFQVAQASSQERTLRRAKIFGVSAAIAATVLLVVATIAESRLSQEQRLGLFEASHPYP
jgi:hypothetical protein